MVNVIVSFPSCCRRITRPLFCGSPFLIYHKLVARKFIRAYFCPVSTRCLTGVVHDCGWYICRGYDSDIVVLNRSDILKVRLPHDINRDSRIPSR